MCFLSGAFLGRIGDRVGPRTRGWLFFGTIFQALCTLLAGILLWVNQDGQSLPTRIVWTNPGGYAAMAFASASMGLQGIMGKRVNTQFATTSACHQSINHTIALTWAHFFSCTYDRVVRADG